MADVDVLHRVGVHRTNERAPTDAHLEHVTVLAPLLPHELEEAVGANAVDELQQSRTGGLHTPAQWHTAGLIATRSCDASAGQYYAPRGQ